MLKEREQARADRDFAAADAIRDKLSAAGVAIEDGPDGSRWRRT
jgi:cysteinyl-tRNA synthetase